MMIKFHNDVIGGHYHNRSLMASIDHGQENHKDFRLSLRGPLLLN